MSSNESSAACLAMIIQYYGRRITLFQCRKFIDAGRDGVSSAAVIAAAKELGLKLNLVLGDINSLGRLQLPVIVNLRPNRFVIIEKRIAGMLRVIDPKIGRSWLTDHKFKEQFSGEILAADPDVGFHQTWPDRIFRISWWHSLGYIWRNFIKPVPQVPALLVQIGGVWLFLLVLGLAMPFLTQVLVDHVLSYHSTNLLHMIGAGMLLVTVTQIVIGYLRVMLNLFLQARIDTYMMPAYYERLAALPLRFFQQRAGGDLLMRGGLVLAIRELLTTNILSIVLFGSLAIIYLAFMFISDPMFGLLVMSAGIIQMLLLFGTRGRIRDLSRSEIAAQSETNAYLVEALAGIETIKTSGTEDRALAGWSGLFMRAVNISLYRDCVVALAGTMISALKSFSSLALLWYQSIRVLDGTMSLGTMLAQNAVAMTFFGWLGTVLDNARRFHQSPAHIDRVMDILNAEPEQDSLAVHIAPRLAGRIEVRGLSFRYDHESPYVFKNVCFTIMPGQKVALVGRTGSGKSTMVKLLLGIYKPTEGEILYDGNPLNELDYHSLRRQCGVVLQEAFLFRDSIRQNITLNDPNIRFEEVIEAARLSAIHDDIMAMPMQYETPAIERGVALSGGQKQRISLARAIVRNPAILFMDEATSHLDVITEKLVHENIARLLYTRIVIAHRLSAIRDADQVLVLKGGEIIEQGTHSQLIEKNGYYAKLI